MKILLAVDGSAPSDAAVEAVSERLWGADSVIRILSAVQTVIPPATNLWLDAGGSIERFQTDLTAYAADITARAARLLQAKGLATETAVRHGDPRDVIIEEAKEWDADLIVVGSHGYTGLQRLFLGSVAQSVVSHAPCSVEVVRVKESRKLRAEAESTEGALTP